MNDYGVVLMVVVLIAAIIHWCWRLSRARTLLEEWADSSGFRLLESEKRDFFKGPFFWGSSKLQVVYRITVCDRSGRERQGWVRCGDWFFGLMGSQVEVKWDDE
ncbi:hypothetical protein KBB96_17820 [Luteolibacter ambystomatis]|uniref:DUF3301 domain-containing protein n=1 Tax=Luteolibacter ambystomatis TaxID=2824561 RepID=A0A975G8L0_9BACT|nr:hypothetical protein [Luteolibacter ambystomatis]QUE50705.1 hypothetical protein KBB96_17820 [Luteolibacter ambystomatis]